MFSSVSLNGGLEVLQNGKKLRTVGVFKPANNLEIINLSPLVSELQGRGIPVILLTGFIPDASAEKLSPLFQGIIYSNINHLELNGKFNKSSKLKKKFWVIQNDREAFDLINAEILKHFRDKYNGAAFIGIGSGEFARAVVDHNGIPIKPERLEGHLESIARIAVEQFSRQQLWKTV